jgi:large conductance mechanosensitive channel
MLNEFKKFALRGNVMELAVALILALAFSAVVSALVSSILMPLIAAAVGQPDFSELSFTVNESEIRYGVFITAVVDFLLIALALFLVVRAVNRWMGTTDDAPKMAECPFCKTSVPINATKCPACTSQLAGQPA